MFASAVMLLTDIALSLPGARVRTSSQFHVLGPDVLIITSSAHKQPRRFEGSNLNQTNALPDINFASDTVTHHRLIDDARSPRASIGALIIERVVSLSARPI